MEPETLSRPGARSTAINRRFALRSGRKAKPGASCGRSRRRPRRRSRPRSRWTASATRSPSGIDRPDTTASSRLRSGRREAPGARRRTSLRPAIVAFNADVALEAGRLTAVWTVVRERRSIVQSSSRTIAGVVGTGRDGVSAGRKLVRAGGRDGRSWRRRRILAIVGRRLPRRAGRLADERRRLVRSGGSLRSRPACHSPCDRDGRERKCSRWVGSLQRCLVCGAGRTAGRR